MAGAALANLFPVSIGIVIFGLALSAVLTSDERLFGGRDVPGVVAFLIAGAVFAGLLSAAVIETVKRMFRLRGLYQRRQIGSWLSERLGDNRAGHRAISQLEQLVSGVVPGLQGFQQEGDIVGPPAQMDTFSRFASSRSRMQFYDLPIEQVTGQIAAALEFATSYSRVDPDFLLLAFTGLDAESLARIQRSRHDRDHGFDVLQADNEQALAHSLRASIDRLQIDVGEGWRKYVRSTAVWLAGSVGYVLGLLGGLDGRDLGVLSLTCLFAGGFSAWAWRDSLAILERLRR